MMAAIILLMLAIGLSLLTSFFFSGSETAVISANQYSLRHRHEQGDAKAGKTAALLARASTLISAVLIGTNLSNVLTVLFFERLVLIRGSSGDAIWPWAHRSLFGFMTGAELITLLAVTPVIVVFAEILPKALFRARADAWIVPLRPALAFSMAVFMPVIKLLDAIVGVFLFPLGGRGPSHSRRVTRSDLIMMLHLPRKREPAVNGEQAEASGAGPLAADAADEEEPDQATLIREPDERRLVQNIIKLEQTQVREIMQPLVELDAVPLARSTVAAFREQARLSGHSRFPAYRDRIVNLVGYIDIYDVIRDANGDRRLEDFVQPAHFVPETKRVDDLLQEFLVMRIKNAIVVDEFGGCSGWVTREDIIEEIVGELEDELDQPTLLISEETDGSYLIQGRTDVEDVNEVLATDFDIADVDTLGGLLMKEMGRIPSTGDEITLDGWRMRILEMDGMRPAVIDVRREDGARR